MTSHLRPAPPVDRADAPAHGAVLQVVPGTRVLWRGPDAVQWESGGRAFVLEGIDPGTLAAIVGTGEPIGSSEPLAAAAQTRRALHALGLLWRPPGIIAPRRTDLDRHDLPERLLPDLGSLAARRGDDAAAVMRSRRGWIVRLIGADRLLASIGSVLAAAGVGRIDLPLEGEVRLWQTMPGGLLIGDEGRRRADAAGTAIRAAAPEVDVGAGGDERAPDLVVLAGSRPPDEALRERLHADGVPHLLVGVDAVRAVIGPLVVPGRTSCLRCADLHRIDRDPAWPALAAQLATAPARFEPSDVALCTAASGIAALQALAFLDGDTPTTIDGTLEMTLPDWRLRRRSRRPHEACECLRDTG